MKNITKEQYNKVRELMKRERNKKHWSKKDLQLILEAQSSFDWSQVHETMLYKQYGSEYCSLLEVVAEVF